MSGWYELASLGVTVRPLDGALPAIVGAWSRFDSPWGTTVELLARELRMLDARLIVLQLDVSEGQLRVDGLPKSTARIDNPTVVIAFESRYGPQRYATAEFSTWQDNVRAIALSLEALRKVDRYGVSKRGEQYQGWRAIPMSTDPAQAMTTREQAVEYLKRWDGDVRRALRDTHPDTGGDEGEFRTVVKARELIGA